MFKEMSDRIQQLVDILEDKHHSIISVRSFADNDPEYCCRIFKCRNCSGEYNGCTGTGANAFYESFDRFKGMPRCRGRIE